MISENKIMVKEIKKDAAAKPEHVKAEPADIHSNGNVEPTATEKKQMFKESLIRTLIATVFGIICGVILYIAYPDTTLAPWAFVLIIIIVATYYIQRRGLYPILKLDVSILDWKSWFGIEFLVIAYCLVTWTILLNTTII